MSKGTLVCAVLLLCWSQGLADDCTRFAFGSLRPGLTVTEAFEIRPPTTRIDSQARDLPLQAWWSAPPYRTIWIAADDGLVTDVVVEMERDPGFLSDLFRDWNRVPSHHGADGFIEQWEWQVPECGLVAHVATVENRTVIGLHSVAEGDTDSGF